MSRRLWFWFEDCGWIRLPGGYLVWRVGAPYYRERHGHGITLFTTPRGRLRWEPTADK